MLSIAKTSTHLADPHELIIEAEACRSHLNNLTRRAVEARPTVTLEELSRLKVCIEELLISHKVLHRQSLGSPCDWRKSFLGGLLVLCLLLASCGQTYLRVEATDHSPAVFVCTSQGALESHADPELVTALSAQGEMMAGFYLRGMNTIYLRTENADTLTIEEALSLAHELQHAADRLHGGSMWKLLAAMGYNHHPIGNETP